MALVVRRNYGGEHAEHHALVAVRQVVEEILTLAALHFHVKGDNSRKVVVLVLPPLPVGNVCLHAQQSVFNFTHGLIRGNGDEVKRKHHACAYVAKLRNHIVLYVVGIIPKKYHPPAAVAEAETVALCFKCIGANIVPEAMPLFSHIVNVKVEIAFLIGPEEVVNQSKAFHSVKLFAF